MSLKQYAYLCLLVLVLALGGCERDEASGDGITFSATPTEGFAPLTVSLATTETGGLQWEFGDTSSPVIDDQRVTHTYTEPGVYTVTLTSTDKDGNTQIATKLIKAHASVNLVVSNFALNSSGTTNQSGTTPSPIVVTPLAVNTVSATIQNIGSAAIKGTGLLHVGYYLSTDQNITIDDIYIGDTSIILGSNNLVPGQFGVPLLGPSEEYSYVHQLAVKGNIPNGAYYAGAIVDYIDYYTWYDFPSATDTLEYIFPSHITIRETNEKDNTSIALGPVSVTAGWIRGNSTTDPLVACNLTRDRDRDDTPANANQLNLGFNNAQQHNLCYDNADWFKFDATQGAQYKITVTVNDDFSGEIDPQLILYNQDQKTILLFHDNMLNAHTFDLESGWCDNDNPADAETHRCAGSQIVWRAEATGTYYVKVRTAHADEDLDDYMHDIDINSTRLNPNTSPDGVGNDTSYTISLQ